jgi:hypothetical protein
MDRKTFLVTIALVLALSATAIFLIGTLNVLSTVATDYQSTLGAGIRSLGRCTNGSEIVYFVGSGDGLSGGSTSFCDNNGKNLGSVSYADVMPPGQSGPTPPIDISTALPRGYGGAVQLPATA